MRETRSSDLLAAPVARMPGFPGGFYGGSPVIYDLRTLLMVAAAVLVSPAVQGAPVVYSAALSGAAEAPPVNSPGTGTTTVAFDPVAHTLSVDVEFSGLVGTTTFAHIHCCTVDPFEATAGVATQVPTFIGFPAGVTAGSYSQTFDLTDADSWNPAFLTANGGTPAGAEAALGFGLASGRAYLNVHSTFAPGGEIRGFLVAAVPEPGSLALIAAALAGALAVGRRPPRRSRPR